MARGRPTPVRFDPHAAARLASWAAAHPGLSLSSAANRLVHEALRAGEHPGVVFRPGPTGRRAGLAAGPDVWEVVRTVKSARVAEPQLSEQDLLRLVVDNTGAPVRLVQVAVRYWASFPEEIDAESTPPRSLSSGPRRRGGGSGSCCAAGDHPAAVG